MFPEKKYPQNNTYKLKALDPKWTLEELHR